MISPLALIFPERKSSVSVNMTEDVETRKLLDKLGSYFESRREGISGRGGFVGNDALPFINRAAKNMGGINVEELGSTLLDGTHTRKPKEQTGIRIRREDGDKNLGSFWEEVRRLEREAGWQV